MTDAKFLKIQRKAQETQTRYAELERIRQNLRIVGEMRAAMKCNRENGRAQWCEIKLVPVFMPLQLNPQGYEGLIDQLLTNLETQLELDWEEAE